MDVSFEFLAFLIGDGFDYPPCDCTTGRNGGCIRGSIRAVYRSGIGKYDQMVEEIRKELNFTSLRFNRLDDMLEAVGIPKEKLCTYCWNGKD